MSSELSAGLVRVATEETAWWTVASRAGVLGFALILVLIGCVVIRIAMVADLGVRRAIALGDFVSKAMASLALDEWFWGNGDVGRDALVVHKGRFVEELT